MVDDDNSLAMKCEIEAEAARLPYEPPAAIWIPLAVEERLLACGKLPGWGGEDRCAGPGMGHLSPNRS
jgi:hypothetical protein